MGRAVLVRLKFTQQSHLCENLAPLKLRSYWKFELFKSPVVGQIPAEMSQAGGETLHSEIHKLIKLRLIENVRYIDGDSITNNFFLL
jgi:hypothetical protein